MSSTEQIEALNEEIEELKELLDKANEKIEELEEKIEDAEGNDISSKLFEAVKEALYTASFPNEKGEANYKKAFEELVNFIENEAGYSYYSQKS